MGIWYRAGTVSVANGSPNVAGALTVWSVYVRPGDRMRFEGSELSYEVLSVPSNTSIILATNFAGTTIVDGAYEIEPSSYRHQIPSDVLEQLRNVLANQTDVFETDGPPLAALGGDKSLAFDPAAREYYRKVDGVWGDAIPLRGADYGGTSTSTETIGLGSRVFVTSEFLAYQAGSRVRVASSASPANWIEGTVASFVDGTLTVTADLVNGTGTFASWNLSLAGELGLTGGQQGLKYAYSNNTAASDPGAGVLKLNNATLSAATVLYISETDANAASIAALIATWDDSTTTALRGTLTIVKDSDPSIYAVYGITSVLTDAGGYDSFTIAYIAGNGAFTNADVVKVQFARTGDNGARGTPGGEAEQYTYSATTTDEDPGSGIIRFNDAALASATMAYVDLLSAGGVDVTAWLDTIGDSTSPNRAVLRVSRNDSPQANFALFYITAVTSATGYRKLVLTYITGAGTLNTTAGNTLVAISRVGDKGTTGNTGAAGLSAGIPFTFSTTTAMADPGPGVIRFNNATLASVTAIAVDDASAASGNPDVSAAVLSWDDSTNLTHRGYLLVKALVAPQNYALFAITGGTTDESGWSQLAVALVSASGAFADTDPIIVEFTRTGNVGIDGTDGVDGVTFIWRGAYSGATAYDENDVVLDNNSSWIALQATTGNAPPTLPTTINTYWQLVAAKGTDGAGTGDVVGPASSIDDYIAVFDGTTGKLLKSGGQTIANAISTAVASALAAVRDSVGSAFDTLAEIATELALKAYASLTLTAGGGLTGGGDLSGDRTFAVGQGTGIVVNADDVAVDKASAANVRAAASNKVVTTDLVETASAFVTLTDAAPVAVDWDAGINFQVTVTANRQIGNPTNGQQGTWRTIYVLGNDATGRTITFGNQFTGEVPTITDCDSGRHYLLMIYCVSATQFVVSSKRALG